MRRLYMQLSNNSQIKQFVQTLALVIAVFMIADPLVGLVLQAVNASPPLLFTETNFTDGLDLVQRDHVPIVFIGSSIMVSAVSPAEFDKNITALTGIERQSANLSVAGGNIDTGISVIRHFALPSGATHIVYGLEIRALNGISPDKTFYETPLAYALSLPSGPEQSILLWLYQHSTFVRYRESIRNFLTNARPPQIYPEQVDRRGWHTLNTRLKFEDLPLDSVTWHEVTEKLASLETLVELCEHQITCTFINLPIHPRLASATNPLSEQAYIAMLRHQIAKAGIVIWDANTDTCRRYLGAESFTDSLHLNTSGGLKFSRIVAALYANQTHSYAIPEHDPAKCVEQILP
jgi:hypothetical protein